MLRRVLLLLVLAVGFALAHTNLASAQGPREIKVHSLEEIKQLQTPIHGGEALTYRVINCSDANSICSVTLTAGKPTDRNGGPTTLSSSGTITCGTSYYNGLNQEVGRLVDDQSTTFYNQYGYAPFSWNALPSKTALAWWGWYWGSSTSQISPGSGVQSGIGYSQITATLNNPVGSGTSHGVRIGFNNGPWSCSAW